MKWSRGSAAALALGVLLISACGGAARGGGAGPVTLLDGFDGTEAAEGRPPDAAIAAGRSSLLLVTNAFASIRSKSGSSQAHATLVDFFASVTPVGEHVMDPRAIYDASSDRFFVSALSVQVPYADCQPPQCSSHVLLAASRGGRPQGLGRADWRLAAIPAADPPLVADQPSLGVAGDAVVLTINLIRAEPGRSLSSAGQIVRLLPKAALTQDGDLPAWHDLSEPGATLQPVVAFGALSTPFLAGIVPSDCTWVIAAVEDALGQPRLQTTDLASSAHRCDRPPAAAQPGGTPLGPDSIGPESRPSFRDGFIWLAHPTAEGTRSLIHWAQVDIRRWPAATLVQEGLLEGSPAALYEPVAMAGPAGAIALFFARLRDTDREALLFAWRRGSDPPRRLREPQMVKQSLGIQPPIGETMQSGRFGDYFDGAFDPVDGSAWFYGEYFPDSVSWGMWVAHVGWGRGEAAGS